MATLEKLIKSSPDYAPAKITLARAYRLQRQDDKADALLDTILKQSPNGEPALTLLLNDQLRARRIPAAISLMERAHQAASGDLGLTARLGDLYIKVGLPQQGARTCARGATLGRAAEPADAATRGKCPTGFEAVRAGA